VPLPKHLDLAKGLSDPSTLPIPPAKRELLAPKIASAGHDALVHALSTAMVVGSCVTLVCAVAVWLLLRPGRGAEEAVPATERPRHELAGVAGH